LRRKRRDLETAAIRAMRGERSFSRADGDTFTERPWHFSPLI